MATITEYLVDGFRVGKAFRVVWNAARGWTVLSTILLLVQGVVPIASLFVLKLVVDRLTALAPTSEAAFLPLVALITLVGAIAVVGTMCNTLAAHVNAVQSQLVADHIQRMVQKKSIDMDLEYYENSQFYDKLHRAQREAASRPIRIVYGLSRFARNGLTLVGALALLVTFHAGIVFAVLLTVLPVIFFKIRHAKETYAWHRDKTASERLSAYLNQVITTSDNAKEVRVFGFGTAILSRFTNLREQIRLSARRLSARQCRKDFITESTASLAAYGSLIFILHATLGGSITLGALVMYFGAFQVAQTSLHAALADLTELYENNLFLSSLYEFLEIPKKVLDPGNPNSMPRPWGHGLRIENLCFRYPGTERLVLRDISMTIQPGETVALVGQNGSGKTTLTKLLCRLYDPSAGRITIDDMDIRKYKADDLRREISIIHQDFGRYHLTARENIWLGCWDTGLDNTAVEAAARQAGIHDDLLALRDGYNTILSRALADGEELSVGQWQKLALARAFVRDAQLIVLDEPTSSLDASSEFEFFENFRSRAKNCAALVISHRFSTVQLADRIYVLDEGRIIESGSHKELNALNGLYASLYRKQASYYQDDQSSLVTHVRRVKAPLGTVVS